MKKRILAALSALMIGGTLFTGCGMRGPHHGGEFSPKAMFSVMKKLDLSSDQKEQFKELRKEHMNGKKDIKEMSKYFTATTFDAQGLEAYMNEHSKDRIALRVAFMQKAYNILSVEQRQIALDELKKRSEKRDNKED